MLGVLKRVFVSVLKLGRRFAESIERVVGSVLKGGSRCCSCVREC